MSLHAVPAGVDLDRLDGVSLDALVVDASVVDDDESSIFDDDESSVFEDDEIEWIRTKEAARILGLSTEATLTYGREGLLTFRAVPNGRRYTWFIRAEVEALAAYRGRVAALHEAVRAAAKSAPFEDDDLLTTGEAGMVAGHTSITMSNFVRWGYIPAARTRNGQARIRYADLRVFMEERENENAEAA